MRYKTPENIKDSYNFPGNRGALLSFALISLIGFIILKDYLLFHKAYFFKGVASDSFNYTYPYMRNVSDYMAKYGLPGWSFSFGMGQSIFPFFLRDPFDIFIYVVGKNYIVYGMAYKELAKIILGGIIFYYYLKNLLLSDYTALIGSLLFAFSGFMIIGGCWYIFSFEAFNTALLLLSFELLFMKNKWYIFPVSILLIGISQPFNLYLYGVFLFFYSILRFVQTKTSLKNAGSVLIKMLGLGITGILCSAPFLLENIMQMLESPRGSGTGSYSHILSSAPLFAIADKIEAGTSVMRFFSNDLVGNGMKFNGWNNYLEAPMFYCGLPCLLLMPQIFRFLAFRIRIFFIFFILIWLLPIIFPYFRHAFWLFTGDYYRAYSFFVALLFIYYSLFVLDSIIKTHRIDLPVLIITLAVLFCLLYYPFFSNKQILYFPERQTPVHSISLFVSIMLVVYAVILYLIHKYSNILYYKWIFLLLIAIELVYLSGITVNNMDAVTATELSQKTGYNDYSIESINFIKRLDKSFYRMDKTYFSTPARWFSLNDAMAQGYRGTSVYSPFNQQHYISYLQLMGIANKYSEYESRWAWGLVNRPILESENQVKYILTKTPIDSFRKMTCDSLDGFGDVHVFRNRYVLPFGYTYQYYIRENVFYNLSNNQKDLVSLCACVLKDSDANKAQGLVEFQLKDTIAESSFNSDQYRLDVDELKTDTLVISKFTETQITGKIRVGQDKMMYLSIPYDKGWKLKVDGESRDKMILSAGMTGVMLKKGEHTIEMAYELRFFRKGLYLSILGLLIYAGLWFYPFKNNKKAD